jgi:hypothetical protein
MKKPKASFILGAYKHVDILQTEWLLQIALYGSKSLPWAIVYDANLFFSKTTPLLCEEHLPSSKDKERARFSRFPK